MKPRSKTKELLEICAIIAVLYHIGDFVVTTPNKLAVTTSLMTAFVIFYFVFCDPASLIRRFIRMARRSFDSQPYVTWFVERDSAKPDMFFEWTKHERLVFMGLSQSSLKTYLSDQLSNNSRFPWKVIEIYFAGDAIGKAFEEADFLKNVKESRHQIAAELTSPSHNEQLTSLQHIHFYQYNALVSYSGSLFGLVNREPDVIYIVESLPVVRGDTKRALTFKIAADGTEDWNASHRGALEHYREGFRTLQKGKTSLGTFSPSLWNESADAWSHFSGHSPVMASEMQGLLDLVGPLKNLKILDLGCGSGEMTCRLVEAGGDEITALDQSPQMLQCAKLRLGSNRVKFALCRIPTAAREDIDIQGETYDLIVLHQALPSMANNPQELERLAEWCRGRLRAHGRVILAAHNTVVSTGSEKWSDPFREHLNAIIGQNERLKKALRQIAKPFGTIDVENAFKEAGFTVDSYHTRRFPITMEERTLMWKAPAIADTFIDVRLVGRKEVEMLIDKTGEAMLGVRTRDRIVSYWIFTLANSSEEQKKRANDYDVLTANGGDRNIK